MDRADRWIELADGVLARRHVELDLTTGLVLGAERALVVDTRGDLVQGAQLRAAIRSVTALPLVIAITHAHFDHCFGTGALPATAAHAHPRCRSTLARTAAAQRTAWVAHYRGRGDDATADALAGTDPPLPAGDVDPCLIVDLGGRTVVLRHLGRGHTDHDVVAEVADAGVVFAGDLVEQGAPPDFGDAEPREWPATVAALLELGADVIVPGHGDPMDRAAVTAQQAELATVAALHEAVGRGELDEQEATARSPFPGVRWR